MERLEGVDMSTEEQDGVIGVLEEEVGRGAGVLKGIAEMARRCVAESAAEGMMVVD